MARCGRSGAPCLLFVCFAFLVPLLLPPFYGSARAEPEVTDILEKGELSIDLQFDYARVKRKARGTSEGLIKKGTVRERETGAEVELSLGVLKGLQLEVATVALFREESRGRFTVGGESVREEEESRGLGDTTFGFSYRVLGQKEAPLTWVVGFALKPPTAGAGEAVKREERNGEVVVRGRKGDAGEGNTNLTFRTAASREFGRFEPFAEVAYTVVGERRTAEGRREPGDEFAATLGLDLLLLKKPSIVLRPQLEFTRVGEEVLRTDARTVTEGRTQYALRGELIWEVVEGLEVRPFGGFTWEDSFRERGPGAADSLRFRDNRGWFAGVVFSIGFSLF